MKHLFIVNPVAGGRDKSEEVRAQVRAAFEKRGGEYEIYVTKAPMDAADRIRREAASGGELRVYACGGDGTFNECVNGAALLPNVAVCPFPTGTGNDFCRLFGEEKDLFRDLEALIEGGVRPIDLIECNGRFCANICSVGIDARIGGDVHRYSHLPLIGGAGAYVVSAAVNMFRGISRKMSIRCGDFTAAGKHTLICACNGQYYGGGFHPSLTARPDDGKLDVFIAKKVNLFQFAALIGKYAKGAAAEMRRLVTHLEGTELEIRFDAPDVVNLVGEIIRSDHVRIKLLPGALRLIVPRGMRYFD